VKLERLKVNAIIDGVNYPVGSLLEKARVPKRLRLPEYWEPAGAVEEGTSEIPPADLTEEVAPEGVSPDEQGSS
jgi:hypothetical protein